MNLTEVLERVGLNQNSFYTLRRRAGLKFMMKGGAEGAGRDRYTEAHLLALGCMLAFHDAGTDPRRASATVEDLFDYISDVAADLGERVERGPSWLNLFNYGDGGRGFSTGQEGAGDLRSDEPTSRVSVDPVAVWKRIHAQTAEKAD